VQITEEFTKLVHSIVNCPLLSSLTLNASDDVHISLTRTIILRHHWIDDFISSVRKSVFHVPRYLILDIVLWQKEMNFNLFLDSIYIYKIWVFMSMRREQGPLLAFKLQMILATA
jgi:hypothetical protein